MASGSELSAEFKKIPDDEKLNSFKGLLKCLHSSLHKLTIANFGVAYQTEIDSLTKRSKVSENAFLNVYKVLAEAPDPYPLLEAAVVCLTHLLHLQPYSHMRRTKQLKLQRHKHLRMRSPVCAPRTLSSDSRPVLSMHPSAVSNNSRPAWTSSFHRRSLKSMLRTMSVCEIMKSGMCHVICPRRRFAVGWVLIGVQGAGLEATGYIIQGPSTGPQTVE
jgi:hypothetical protein